VVAVALAIIYFVVEARLDRVYDVPVEQVGVPPQVTAEGRDWPLALVSLCEECHGPDLAGQLLLDDNIGRLAAPNLTSGRGGIGGTYGDADWVRALRHGVRPSGRPLLGMPSEVWNQLDDSDLAEIIAYVKSVPPVDRELPTSDLKLMGRVMLVAGMIPPEAIPAEIIDHTAARPAAIQPGVTVEYGKYMADIACATCHSQDMAGGLLEGEGRNLTPAGDLARWSEDDFIHTLRTGVAPDGNDLDPELMPWKQINQLSDDQLRAIWLYLKSLPPVETQEAGQ
jgi:mono/diheme cytochrome c family protein